MNDSQNDKYLRNSINEKGTVKVTVRNRNDGHILRQKRGIKFPLGNEKMFLNDVLHS